MRSWAAPARLWATALRSEYPGGPPPAPPSGDTRSTWAAMWLSRTTTWRLSVGTLSRSDTRPGW